MPKQAVSVSCGASGLYSVTEVTGVRVDLRKEVPNRCAVLVERGRAETPTGYPRDPTR